MKSYQIKLLTDPPRFHCFGREREDRENLSHDFPDQFRHRHCKWDTSVIIETLQKKLDAFEDTHEHVIAHDNIPRRLGVSLSRRC